MFRLERGNQQSAERATLPVVQVKRGFPEGSQLPRTLTWSSPVSRTPASSLGGRRGAIAASRGRDRFAPDSPHRQAVRPISTGRRRGRGFPYSFRGFAGVGCNARRSGGAERAAFSGPVSSPDFRGERLRRPRRQAAAPLPGERRSGLSKRKRSILARRVCSTKRNRNRAASATR